MSGRRAAPGGGPVGRRLVRRYNVFARYVMPRLYADRSRLTDAIHRQYISPFPIPDDRRGTWVFPRAIRGERDWLASLWERRATATDHPTLLVWGAADIGFGPVFDTWREAFGGATVHAFDDVGHYVQEELGPNLVPLVREFLASLPDEERESRVEK